jgi:low temperature requirement protein LtrA
VGGGLALELLFDLVFVFAVSQLSHHLLDHLSWRGAAETLVLLIAVFGIWSGTSFEATLLHIARSHARWLLLAVMDHRHGAAVDRGRDRLR